MSGQKEKIKTILPSEIKWAKPLVLNKDQIKFVKKVETPVLESPRNQDLEMTPNFHDNPFQARISNFEPDTPDFNQLQDLFEENLEIQPISKKKRSGSIFSIFKKKEENQSLTQRNSTEKDQEKIENVLTRIELLQQRLHETNLGESLREREKIINDNKFEVKNLDQELIMIKIETALLKCQMEESVIESLEIQRMEAVNSEEQKEPAEQELLVPQKQDSVKNSMNKFKNKIRNTLKRVPSPLRSKEVSPNNFQPKISFPSIPNSWKPRSKTVILMEKKVSATDPVVQDDPFSLQRHPEPQPRPSVGSKKSKRLSRTYSSNGQSGGRPSIPFIVEESKDIPIKRESIDDEPFIANNTEKNLCDLAQSSISPDRTNGITDDTTKPTNDYSPEQTKTGYFGTILQSRRLTQLTKPQGQNDKQKEQKNLKKAQEYFQYFQNKHTEKQLDYWVKVYLPIIQNNEHQKNAKLKSEILRGSIPMSFRGQLWSAFIGNNLRINSQVFEEFKSDYTFGRTSDQIQQTLEKKQPSKWDQGEPAKTKRIMNFGSVKKDSLLMKDIPRTFPHLNELFEQVHSLSKSLIDVLGAFQNYRPDVGYVQGMCYLAAMLLIHQTRPEECYVSFCNLILKYDLLFDFYMTEHIQILKTYKVFWRLIKENTPHLYTNLKENDATCKMFLFPWIITLFSNSFEIDLCAILWDQIFYFGQFHILRIGVAICQIIEKKFKLQLNEESPEYIDAQIYLKNAKQHILNEELIGTLKNQKLSLKYIDQLYQKVEKQFEK